MCSGGNQGEPYVDQYDWRGKRWPSDWRTEANKHRIAEAWDIPDYWSMLSAIVLGYPVVRGMAKHCVLQVTKTDVLNSWGTNWGNNGIGPWASSEREITQGIEYYGAWALRCTAAEDAPMVEGQMPPIGDEIIRRRRWRRWGRR